MTLLTPANALRLAMSDFSPLQSQRSDQDDTKNSEPTANPMPGDDGPSQEDQWWLEFN